MSSWEALDVALDATLERGETFNLWWRDDDAGRGHPALHRLIDLAEGHDLPLALAVVPAWLDATAQGVIAAASHLTVLQHGYAHRNHAGQGAKSIELGGRRFDNILQELRHGFDQLQDAFGSAFMPVLVPPWNRIDRVLFPHLNRLGYQGLSVYGPRTAPEVAPGVALINTHIDPIDWRGSRGFLGEAVVLERFIESLSADEPIGLLTHHLVMDDSGWTFLDELFTVLRRHPAARLCPVPSLFERERDVLRSLEPK